MSVGVRGEVRATGAYELLERAGRFIQGGTPHQAAMLLGEAKLLEPDKGSIREALGRALYLSGRTARARREVAKAGQIDPVNDYAHFRLAPSFARTRQRTRAIPHLKPAIAMRPGVEGYQGALALLRREGASGRTAFVIGERGIREALEGAGVVLVDGEPERTDLVVVGWDRDADYAKLRTASLLVERGARLIATNADASYPASDGVWPGAGALLAAVTTTTGAQPTVVGKPARPLFEAAAEA